MLTLSNGVLVHSFMMPRRKSLLSKTVPFLLVGLLAFVLYLVFFVNINEMITVIKQTSIPIYLFSVVATTLEMFFFALSWYYFLTFLSASVSFKRAFLYSWTSNFIDLLIPAESISGEISRVYFVSQDGVDPGKAVASVVTQRILGVLIITGSLIIGILWRSSFPSLVQSLVLLVVAATVIFLTLFLVVFCKENWVRSAIRKIIDLVEHVGRGRWNFDEWRSKADEALKAFYESLRTFRANPKKLALPVMFSVFWWLCSILVYYIVFAAIGYIIDWGILVIGFSLVAALRSVPVGVPAEIGVTEIAMTTVFGALIGPEKLYISAAATVLIRIVTVFFKFVVGFGAFQWVGIKTLKESEIALNK